VSGTNILQRTSVTEPDNVDNDLLVSTPKIVVGLNTESERAFGANHGDTVLCITFNGEVLTLQVLESELAVAYTLDAEL
jgi:hypothetical protein